MLCTAFAFAYDKQYSLSANYPKGCGELFKAHMRENHPGALLFHVERAFGSRQDLMFEAFPAIYMNRRYTLEFEYMRMGLPKKQDNILSCNLFMMQSSVELIALARLLSIWYLSITIPLRWLTGKTQELAEYGWCARSISRPINTLYEASKTLLENPSLVLSEMYMMSIFSEFMDKLPPFRQFRLDIFTERKMHVVCRQSGAKVMHLAELRNECFHPIDEDNKGRCSLLSMRLLS